MRTTVDNFLGRIMMVLLRFRIMVVLLRFDILMVLLRFSIMIVLLQLVMDVILDDRVRAVVFVGSWVDDTLETEWERFCLPRVFEEER